MSESVEFSPDVESEDMVSIIRADSSESNPSAFQRYAVPPQFDGNSSEEDEPLEQNEEKSETLAVSNDDTDVPEDDTSLAYQPLVADEFGDFVSSENFGDYYTNVDPTDPSFLAAERPNSENESNNMSNNQVSEQKSDESLSAQSPTEVPVPAPQRISIPPLDADKINLIKAAMAKVSIGQPSFNTVALAELLERSKLRVGDEITE
eukprot:gene21315-24184_t